ncbi:MAG: ATP-binding protein [Myxococcota bacterium]
MPRSGAHILIIDGDVEIRRLMAIAIQEHDPGATVEAVGTVLELVDQLALPVPWDVILWDPGTTPWLSRSDGLAGLVQRQPASRIWLIDSYPSDDPMQAMMAGAAGSLPKNLHTVSRLGAVLGPASPASGSAPTRRPGMSLGPQDVAPTRIPRSERSPSDATRPASHSAVLARADGSGVQSAPPLKAEPDAAEPRTGRSPERLQLVHDLKEPLRTIRLLLERCDRDFRDSIPQEARAMIQWAMRSASQLSEDIEETVEDAPGPVVETDANEAVTEALANLSALIEESRGKVTCEPLPKVSVKPAIVRRIFENLISNALKYRGEGPPEIHVAAQHLRGEGLFSVRDNGLGLPEQLKRSAFEPGASGENGGTGMGLFIVRSLLEQVGGEIWFDTLPGEGTTFFFTLPLASPTSRAEVGD